MVEMVTGPPGHCIRLLLDERHNSTPDAEYQL